MARSGVDEVVLLTGFPQLLARKVCEELLRERGTVVRAVVPAKFLGAARTALDALPLEARARVSLIEGDVAAIDLGLSGAELAELAKEVDVVHHCAHVTYPGAAPKLATQVNVGGTAEVIEVARTFRALRCVVHHSTATVSGDRSGLVLEDELDHGQRFHDVIEETRARAERLVRQAMRELPIAVVRPSMIVGDSRTGEVDRLDGPYLLILLMLTSPPELALPLPGRGDAPLNLVPVDWVARASVAIGRHAEAAGKTFHLVDPAPASARRVFELVAEAGGRRSPRGFIPANLTKALLRAPGLERLVQRPRALLDALGTNVTYGTRNADAVLGPAGLPCPPFESYAARLVGAVRARLDERARRRDDEIADPLS
jgi:thioester reductase-like protein